MSEWRNDPATDKQKEKLRFFDCTWDEGITKGQASDAIEECIKKFPQIEQSYENRPATKEQKAKLKSYGENSCRASGEPLTYQEAKELIQDCEISEQQKELDELDKEYIIDVGDWAELYPGLTWNRVQKAAKALDASLPGWRQNKNHIDIMLEKVGELNPQLVEKWNKKRVPKRGTKRRSRKGGTSGIVVLLFVIIWIIYKAIFKGSR